jgi:hypothetical protein
VPAMRSTRKSETFLWLGIFTLSCETGSFITTYETHF